MNTLEQAGAQRSTAASSGAANGTIERVPTGIPGFDELVEGGLPRGRITLITGSTGSGKTTFGFQFLEAGIRAEEPGVYVTLQEEIGDLHQDMGRHGWDLEAHVQANKLALLKSPIPFEGDTPLSMDALLDQVHQAVTQINAKRLVFDSLAALGLPDDDSVRLRRDVLRLCAMLRESGCTTLLITERPEDGGRLTTFDMEQFVAQGVIVLHVAHTYRGIEVRKMRGTRHDTNVHRMRITERGLIVSPGEHPFG